MEIDIQFHEESALLPSFFDLDLTTKWLISIAHQHHKEIGFLNFILCDDEGLLDINRTYLDHDYYTDIITFPYREDGILEADIYLSITRIEDNAKELHEPFQKEWLRVLAHGVLHLCGYKDKTEEDSQKMRLAEDTAIAQFGV